jgi:hypothetical protein
MMKLSDLKTSLPKPGGKGRKGSDGGGVKPPKFAVDLYADLRDRRLLPLVALLAVAIVAVPVLLAGGGGEEDETPPPFASPAVGSPTSFSVVPSSTQLRDYHRRLGFRHARDPFARPDEGGSASSGGGAEEGQGAKQSEATSAGPATVESGGGSEAAGTETSSSAAPPKSTHVVVENQVIGYTVDLKAGYLGHVSEHQGLEPMTKLPNDKNPVVVFVGLSPDDKRALLLMTSNVTAFYGKGRCALEKQACQLLELKPGKSATFAYGYGEERFKVTLQRIVPVVRRPNSASGSGTKTTGP